MCEDRRWAGMRQVEAVQLVQKIRVIIANSAQLERIVNEEFHRYRKGKLKQEENVVSVNAGGSLADDIKASLVEPNISFDATVDLACLILERISLPVDRDMVSCWVASACSTFSHSRLEADFVTGSRVRFIVDWVLRCLAEYWIGKSPEQYFHRQFLIGFDHPTSMMESGLQLCGPVAHGLFGNIWLQARQKKSFERSLKSQVLAALPSAQPYLASVPSSHMQPSRTHEEREKSSFSLPDLPVSARSTASPRPSMTPRGFSPVAPSSPPPVPAQSSRGKHVVISVSKSLCKLPPEILSNRIRELIKMEPLPYVLPLIDAYEDLENVHLVYAPLSQSTVCLTDHIYDLMHKNTPESQEQSFCERTIQEIIWKVMSMVKAAHGRGLVHACLRIGACYLDAAADYDSFCILEFGLHQLFHLPSAIPPLASTLPLDIDPQDPVPPYRRDFQAVAEIAYLLLGGQPICPLESSVEQRRQRFKCGAASFVDKAFGGTSEAAKAFLMDLLRPAQWSKQSKIPLCHLATVHMAHRWFFEKARDVDEACDMMVMRKYDTWKNSVRLQINLLKLVSDRITLAGISRLRADLEPHVDTSGRVCWVQLEKCLQRVCLIPADLLKKVSKAFGENVHASSLHVRDFCNDITAWRKKRVREVLWQVFSRGKASDGRMNAEACADGLTSGVLHVWSRPARVLEVVFPLVGVDHHSGSSEMDQKEKLSMLIGTNSVVSFLELVSKTDAAQVL